jgi:type II secretory ATPase GspE/PulE/Tfp pilus assembly ATPase PilB-like protein
MRVLPTDAATLDLEGLGLGEQEHTRIVRTLARPSGMILVTGPTGAGKSTTLYAMLTHLSAGRRSLVNISTVEDPVEHPLPRICQVSINPAAGIDFASGLRALLRQDPDVLMVGEIRDRETAEIAVRAALVGRLLLSTLHTNDTTSAIPRLIDMGVEPFLLASTLNTIIAQRLVRRICTGCRETAPLNPSALAMLEHYRAAVDTAVPVEPAAHDVRVYHGRGCALCDGTGYRGRVGLFEVLDINDELRDLTLARRDSASLRRAGLAAGMQTMFASGWNKVMLAETTPEEVMRVAA